MARMTVCIDAGIALKMIFPEPDSDSAQNFMEEWLARGTLVIAPSLWAYEVTSVIRNRAHRGHLDPDLEAEAFETVHNLPVNLFAPDGLHRRAWELTRQYKQPVAYDAHYLALAEMAQAHFWTADERLFNTVREEIPWVKWLGDR